MKTTAAARGNRICVTPPSPYQVARPTHHEASKAKRIVQSTFSLLTAAAPKSWLLVRSIIGYTIHWVVPMSVL
jgi:hypothetical protein